MNEAQVLTKYGTCTDTKPAASDASGAGRGNPIFSRRTCSANQPIRALFCCPNSVYGGLGGARASVAGSLRPVFHPHPGRHPITVESDVAVP